MGSGDYSFFYLSGLSLGAIMLAYGFFKKAQFGAYKKVPLRDMYSLVIGEKQFVSGTAHSPAQVPSPVSRTPCVFYVEKVDRLEKTYSSGRGNRHRWERVSETAYGAFFLKDGSGTAFVAPTFDSADLSRTETSFCAEVMRVAGSEKKHESLIKEGGDVTVLGSPRPFSEFMAYLRMKGDMLLPAELVQELMRLEKDSAGAAMKCFFGPAIEKVADQTHKEYISNGESVANMLMQIGVVVAVFSAVAMITM